jgi:hypothetical protein
VPWRLAVLGREKGLDEVPCDRRADCSAAHAKNVHVIVLNALFGGKVIVDQRSAGTGKFILAD